MVTTSFPLKTQLRRKFTLSIGNLLLYHFIIFSKTMLLYPAFSIAVCFWEEKQKQQLHESRRIRMKKRNFYWSYECSFLNESNILFNTFYSVYREHGLLKLAQKWHMVTVSISVFMESWKWSCINLKLKL